MRYLIAIFVVFVFIAVTWESPSPRLPWVGVAIASDIPIIIDESDIAITGVCSICEPINDGKLHFCSGHKKEVDNELL
jgi:hypothetical protein